MGGKDWRRYSSDDPRRIGGRITTLAFAARHVQSYVSNSEWGNISAIAAADKGMLGRVKITNAEIAARRSANRSRPLSERTIREGTGRLVKEGRWIQREGWTYIVVGAADHSVFRCDHPDCKNDRSMVDKLKAADELRERARVKKQRQRAAARQDS